MIKESTKRGQVLPENLLFIILNLVFLTILIVFLYSKMSSEALIEEKYSKQIALIIDSAKPGMEIVLNMEDAFELARENRFSLEDVVSIQGNKVTVKLRDEGGNSYYFFNDVNVNSYYDSSSGKNYVIESLSYKEDENEQERN